MMEGGSVSKHLSMLKRYDPRSALFREMSGSTAGNKTKIISDELTEDDILVLQEGFLVNGFHHVQVSDVKNGREFIKAFLRSLDCYHNVACLTIDSLSDERGVTDLYRELCEYAREKTVKGCLDEFFVEQFYYDFLWIECSDRLAQEFELEAFIQKLLHLKLTNTLPITLLHYTKILSNC